MYGVVLGVLAALFALRVLGQALVAAGLAPFLPPMEQWYSGLVPYPVLLPIQAVMLVLMAKLIVDVWRGSGAFSVARPRLGRILKGFSYFYALAMVARYVIVMIVHPEWRWFGHTIPIWFHLVLAAFVHTYGRYLVASGDVRKVSSPDR